MNLAVTAAHSVKLKESKHQQRAEKKPWNISVYGNINCRWCIWNCPQKLGKKKELDIKG